MSPRTDRLRIALVYDDTLDRHGGIAQYCLTLGAQLQRRGHEVAYLVGQSDTNDRQGAPVRSLARNVVVCFNGNRLSIPLRSSRREIAATLVAARVDVVHVQVPYSPVMAGRVLATVDDETAVVGTCHVYSERPIPRAGARLLGRVTAETLRRFDELVAVSPPAAEFARLLGVQVSAVVPNMIEIEALQGGPAPRGRARPTIVYVGNLVPRKGVDGLIAGFAVLAVDHPTARLTIAGDGPLRGRLERQAQRLGVAHRVDFAGAVSEAEKGVLLRNADIACFPARYGESFGVVLLEAMAAGAGVVVGGANPGHRFVLGRDELCVDPDAPLAVADALRRLLSNPASRRKLAREQAETVVRFDAACVTDQVMEVYERALARRNRRGRRAREATRTWPATTS